MRDKFSTLDIVKALSIPRERLRDWMNNGFVVPTTRSEGQGTKAIFTRDDIYLVALFVDLRKNSKTFLKWEGIELDSKELTCLYVPEGFALGFQTLEDNTELLYQMSEWYKPEFSEGIIWDDKELGIKWPIIMSMISEKDLSLPNLVETLKKLED